MKERNITAPEPRGTLFQIGAQIMDDPVATPGRVDRWFRLLAEHGMPLARVFIPRTREELTRMDWFFRAAERHGVGISATLGGAPSPANARWIHSVVRRYQNSPALDSWILYNEPGQAPAADPRALRHYRRWLRAKYGTIQALNRAWGSRHASFDRIAFDPSWMGGPFFGIPAPFLDWHRFWRQYLSEWLAWIAGEIRKHDTHHPTHVNPHALIANLAASSLDLPSWRSFLDTYGASCHPSWHFGLLARSQYALGVSYICDLVGGAAGAKPFWITELQGGGNTNSGGRPLYPHPPDIAQWLWLIFGAGARRVIFWLLNNRSFGVESGEWSLLDLQDQPSERLKAASRVAASAKALDRLLPDARSVMAPVTILLSLETMALQERFERTQPLTSTERGVTTRLEGRGRNAHLLSALALYEAFQRMGMAVRIRHLHDFEWETAQPHLILLPDVAALSADQARQVTAFVRAGGHLLATGLTGAWDPENRFWTLGAGFPLDAVFGATLKEIHTLESAGTLQLAKPRLKLPVHLWMGEILNRSAEPLGTEQGRVTAVRHAYGKGQAVWIPALIELGAWLGGDSGPLTTLLADLSASVVRDMPFRFAAPQADTVMRVLRSGSSFLTVIANGSLEEKRVQLVVPSGLRPRPIWEEGSRLAKGNTAVLEPRGTLVVLWRP